MSLNGVQVSGTAKSGGFFLRGAESGVFVLPARGDLMNAREGETVSVEGVILQMPRGMKDRLNTHGNTNTDIYIWATETKKQAR